jgi:DNA-binding transcriptional regulator YiaG
MTANDITDLLKLKGWSQVQLAGMLHVHESSVSLWLHGARNPTGPARILMRQWLDEARAAKEREPGSAG